MPTNFHTVPVLGYPVFCDQLSIDPHQKAIIATINPHSYCVAKRDKQFESALKSSDILLPDGIGIVMAARFLKGKRIRKIAGADLHDHLLQLANEQALSVFYLGASQTTLDKISQKVATEFPSIQLASYSPPFKPVFSDEDHQRMIQAVNSFHPDILFVGMTAPKQEKWTFEHHDKLQATVICSIGAVFDFYAGTVKRPHPFWIKIGLEWFVRFIKEPKRLAERNLVSMPKFLWDVIKAKF